MKPLVVISALVGIVFLILAVMYAVLPARSLPLFVPGYAMAVARYHYTHAVASFAVAVVLFAFAWMQSGKK